MDRRSFNKFLVGLGGVAVTGGLGIKTAAAATQIQIATATTTGAFYPIGGVMASVLSKNLDGYNFTAEATGGSVENARLLRAGEVQVAFMGADTFYDALNGIEAFKGQKYELATLGRLYGNPFHVVALASSGIKDLDDLKGKTVALGAPGSGSANKAKLIFTLAGLDIPEVIKPTYLSFAEGSAAVLDKRIDAVVISVGLPSGNIQEMATTHKIELVNFPEDQVQKIVKELPFFRPFTIPADTYNGVTHPTSTTIAPNYLVVSPSMKDDLAYAITKTLFLDQLDEVKLSHAAMRQTSLEELVDTDMPLHPGAERFYREQGVLS